MDNNAGTLLRGFFVWLIVSKTHGDFPG